MFDTKFCENRWRLLNFRRIWIFLFSVPWHQILKIRCIHEASFVRKPKSSGVYVLKKKLLWNRWGSNMRISIQILFTFSSHTEYVKRESIVFDGFAKFSAHDKMCMQYTYKISPVGSHRVPRCWNWHIYLCILRINISFVRFAWFSLRCPFCTFCSTIIFECMQEMGKLKPDQTGEILH